jgi:hypothetical protein
MTTQYPPPRRHKSPNNAGKKHASLAVRINNAANELNPFLVVVALGLLILNIIFYLGMSVSRYPPAAAAPHPAAYSTRAGAASSEPQASRARY